MRFLAVGASAAVALMLAGVSEADDISCSGAPCNGTDGNDRIVGTPILDTIWTKANLTSTEAIRSAAFARTDRASQ
jgi:hypothetical protein